MQFIKPENSNLKFGAGKNPNTGDLDVTMAFRHDIPGRVFNVSEWVVSDEELAEIIRTKRVYLSIMGAGMMPVNILAYDPFKHYGYYPALVIDKKLENGNVVKTINDPQAEESFMRWMEFVVGELNSRPYFQNLPRNPTHYAPKETWRSLFDAGSMYEEVVANLEKFHANKNGFTQN